MVATTRDSTEFGIAAGEILSRYQHPVYAAITRVLGPNKSLADDAFQETFLRLFRWLALHRDKAPLLSTARLLATFARRATIDMLRKHRPEEPILADLESPGRPAARQMEDSLYVQEMLATLDDRSQKILLLSIFEDLPDREVAKRLSLSTNHVRQLRFRALKKLRELQALDDLANLIDPV